MSKNLKRSRSDKSLPSRKKVKLARNQAPLKKKKSVAVRGDALKWKEATLPDRLEDAEGFYGLEEIDDIEVVKDEATGQISFRTSNAELVGDVEESSHADGEWTGFTDEAEPNSASASTSNGSISSDVPETSSRSTPEVKPKGSSSIPQDDHEQDEIDSDIDFDALTNKDSEIDADISAWKDLGLSHEILPAISSLGFSEPTPIQRAAIPPACEGRDVIGKAVTGSGKTLAFGIPIVEKWLLARQDPTDADDNTPTAFILAPTRELAHQISQHLIALCKSLHQSPRIATVTGGLSVTKQQRQLGNADIIIGTPGRLWEVINTSSGLVDRLRRVKYLVIDEADRLLSEGHFKEVQEILSVLDKKVTNDEYEGAPTSENGIERQTLVFSATFHKGLQQKLANKQKWSPHDNKLLTNTQSLEYLLQKLKFQRNTKPTFIDANPISQMAERLSESILECGAMQKDLYTYALLLRQQHEHAKTLRSITTASRDEKLARTLIFTNSISTVKRLVPLLTNLKIPSTTVLSLHSSMAQKARLRSLERFASPPDKSVTSAILIATDVAARGLDIKGISTIIHYHVPRAADTYIHRSGRTARSTNSGQSILICSPDEVMGVTRLITKVHSDKAQGKSNSKAAIQPLYLPANLPQQLQRRLDLAQKITAATLDTEKSNSDSNFLRTAAEELGVDYSSDEFNEKSAKNKRGRGGGRDKKRQENVIDKANGKVEMWKAELRVEMRKSVDLGDGSIKGSGRFLAGGAVDMEKLLQERGMA